MDDVGARPLSLGILAGMVLRLVPDLPLLWRTPTSVQFGSDQPVVVLEDVSEGEDRLIATLAAGISQSGFAMLARSLGVPDEVAEALLDELAPVLVTDAAEPLPRAAVLGQSPLARSIAGLLSSVGALGSPAEAAVVVLVADWVLAPAEHLAWLNRDVPHLPVVMSERSVAVGPLVEPGDGPCLYCVQLARLEADPSWLAVATQLLGRPGREVGELERAEVSAFVARRVLERLTGTRSRGRAWRMDAAGGVSSRVWGRHPDCRCAAPAGTDWAAAPERAGRAAPTTVSAVGAPA